jgi:MFS transporter, PAT family, beta-lactamase induction signal transducer AmpG
MDRMADQDIVGRADSGRALELPPFWQRLSTLFCLYIVQGLPYGFFISVLPLFLRQAGWSRTAIGLYGLLGLPWILKPLWAPLVDRFSWPALGRRKSWILPCVTVSSVLALLLALEEPRAGGSITCLLWVVFGINLVAATQDIAVDGLAVDILSARERGPGNAAQVVGFKTGMLCTGGFLLAVSGQLGWAGICVGMALISLPVLFFSARYPEARGLRAAEESPPGMGEIIGSFLALASRPGFAMALVLIGTYKMGEAGVDAMYRLFLLDSGWDAPAIGVLCGSWGLAFSLAGSLTGGWVGQTQERMKSLFWIGVLRAGPLVIIALLPFLKQPLSSWLVYSATLAEHFAGGMITPVMFAFMMDLCDRKVGATHYTALAAVEVVGKMSVSAVSGLLADRIGYGGLFSVGAGISLLWPMAVYAGRKRV